MRIGARAGPVWISGNAGSGCAPGCMGLIGVALVIGLAVVAGEYVFGWPAVLLAHRASGGARWGAEAAWLVFLLFVVPFALIRFASRSAAARKGQKITGVIRDYSTNPIPGGTAHVKFTIGTPKKNYQAEKAGAAVGDPLLALDNGDFVSAVWHEAENRLDQIRKLY